MNNPEIKIRALKETAEESYRIALGMVVIFSVVGTHFVERVVTLVKSPINVDSMDVGMSAGALLISTAIFLITHTIGSNALKTAKEIESKI